ncbi:MAG: PilZ domain-containing protein [Vulcanimicrobiota bacterium]
MDLISEMKNLFNKIWGKRLEHLLRERRNSPRKPCDIAGIYTYLEQAAVPLVIKDVGLYGMHVISYKKLKPGSTLLVSVREDSKLFEKSRYDHTDVYMSVLWCTKDDEDFKAGLQFTDSYEKIVNSWLGLLLSKYDLRRDEASYKRKTVRVSADIPIVWKILGGEKEHYGTLVDISLQGALLEVDRNIDDREHLWLKVGPYKKLRPLICHATVVHTHHSRSIKKWFAGVTLTTLDEVRMELLQQYLTDLYLKSE